jgi:hypothetical protein
MANTNYGDGFLVAAANATQGPFSLLGGKYGVTCVATFGADSVALQNLGPDGTTFVTAASFTANGYQAVARITAAEPRPVERTTDSGRVTIR